VQGVSVSVQTNGFLLSVRLPCCLTPGQGLRWQNTVSTPARLWMYTCFHRGIYHSVAKLWSALLQTVCFVFVYPVAKKTRREEFHLWVDKKEDWAITQAEITQIEAAIRLFYVRVCFMLAFVRLWCSVVQYCSHHLWLETVFHLKA